MPRIDPKTGQPVVHRRPVEPPERTVIPSGVTDDPGFTRHVIQSRREQEGAPPSLAVGQRLYIHSATGNYTNQETENPVYYDSFSNTLMLRRTPISAVHGMNVPEDSSIQQFRSSILEDLQVQARQVSTP